MFQVSRLVSRARIQAQAAELERQQSEQHTGGSLPAGRARISLRAPAQCPHTAHSRLMISKLIGSMFLNI